jgi:predicted methyltransferase
MEFKQIASYDNFMLANMTLGLLEANNINCHLEDENIVTIDPLLNQAVGGIKLMVHQTQLERATDLIKEAETNYLNELVCPHCKTKGIFLEEKVNVPQTFWGKLKNQIAYGQTEIRSKKYRCKSHYHLIDELPLTF